MNPTNLIAATDTNYEFHTATANGFIRTDLSICGRHKRCECGFWMVTSTCAHIVAAEKFLAECQTIEQMDAEAEGLDEFLASANDGRICPTCKQDCTVVETESGAGLSEMIYCFNCDEDHTRHFELEAMQ